MTRFVTFIENVVEIFPLWFFNLILTYTRGYFNFNLEV